MSPPAKKGGRAPAKRKASSKRKAPAKRKAAPKKRKASTKRKAAPRKRRAAPRRKAKRKAKRKTGNRWVLKSTIVLCIGVLLGVSFVVLALYREAQVTVAARLDGAVWDTPGRVYGAPIEIWPGLQLTPAELAADLRAAGYAQVQQANAPGDFQVAVDAVKVKTAAFSGPGWSIPAAEHLVTFRDGRVRSVSPSSPARLAPPVIATLAGPSAERRSLVPLDDIPPRLQQAVLAMEDADFHDHPGLSFTGVIRALLVNLAAGRTVQGGSTLTQQLAKNLFLDPERSLARKAREAFLALAIEKQLDKDAILELYLNGIYLGQAGGQGIHGMAEASRVFFGKPVDRLELGESATLAGIISAPAAYSPLNHPDRALVRRDLTLGRMATLGMIDKLTLERERERGLEVRPTNLARGASWGVDQAVEIAEAGRGAGSVPSLGLHVHTTLSSALQRLAERAVREGLAQVEARHPGAVGVQAAMVVIDSTDGRVLALVGGRDYGTSSFNRAVHAKRQLGSVVKPLTMVKALGTDRRLRLTSRLRDEPIERRFAGKVWRPANYDGVYRGSVSLRQAIVHSYNIPAIHLAERVGLGPLQSFWRELGLEHATKLPSASLGAFEATPLQVAGAYTIFPSGGLYRAPRLVLGVVDATGQAEPVPVDGARRVVSSGAAALTVRVLEDVIESGTGQGAAAFGVGPSAGGKTGTTDDGRDAWFVGFTPDLVVAVWVGFDQGRSHGLSGAKAALPIWARFVAASGTDHERFVGTASLVSTQVCVETLLPAAPDCPDTYTEYYGKGNLPQGSCPLHGGEASPATAGDIGPGGEQGSTEPDTRQGVLKRLRQRLRGQDD